VIEAALRREGYRLAVRSRGEHPDADTDLYLADTLNEMGLFLRLADVVVMGGSFAPALGLPPVGGHNPLEPARLGKPAVTGPDASNWAGVTETLVRAGGLAVVQAPSELSGAVAPLLASPDAARAMGERARRAAAEANGGLDVLWSRLASMLPDGTRR
jgi:3-deoxy-D-manno-octulosonic-acid transferase